MPRHDAPPPPGERRAGDQVGVGTTTRLDRTPRLSQRGASPTLTYLAGRERLGRIPADPADLFDLIAEALGGRQLAGDYVDQMRADHADAAWHHDDAGCPVCGTWRDRLEAGSAS